VYITPKGGILDVKSTPTRPSSVALHAPYPNPVRDRATLTFDTRVSGPVLLTVHDMLGRQVATLVDRLLDAGTHQTDFHISGLHSGTYRILLVSSDQRAWKTITIVR
jgi:hypothetical protein